MKWDRFLGSTLLFSACLLSTAAEKNACVWKCRDFTADNVILKGGAAVQNGKLVLNGKTAYAEIPDSRKIQLTQSGMTLSIVTRLRDQGIKDGQNDAHDMFFCKEKTFIFGRNCRGYYVNFHNGKKYCADLKGGLLPPAREWIHAAAVFEYLNDKAQGDVGFILRIYENGEQICSRKFLWAEPVSRDVPVKLGSGFGGGPWLLNGEIGEAAIFNRALTPGEISNLFQKSRYTPKIPKGFTEINADLSQRIDTTKKRYRHPVAKWIVNALKRSAATGYPQSEIRQFLDRYEKLADIQDIRKLQPEFNRKMKGLFLYANPEIAVLLYLGKGQGAHPLAGLYSMKSRKDIFGERTLSWKIRGRTGKKQVEVRSNSPSVHWVSRLDGNSGLNIRWESSGPLKFTANSRITFSGGRVESDLKVTGISGLLTEVNYPQYAFARLNDGADIMVYPYMLGVLVNDPTRESFSRGQSARYPSSRATMQFGAYYDRETGIYFGFEDGLARTKDYEVKGLRGNLHAGWTSPVAWNPEDKTNTFSMNGKAVLELYRGEWYEAGTVYRRFLERDAAWWIRELPRKDSPEWFRNNAVTILAVMGTEHNVEQHRDISAYLKLYFEQPLILHWYAWEDFNRAGWPHFIPAEHTLRLNKQIRSSGNHTIPYIDDRLWKVKDGPNNTDWMYQSRGLKYAVLNPDNSINTEKYTTKGEFTVMCPAVKGWQEILVKLTERVADYGFSGAYHDQVAAGAPVYCFDPRHGHRLNDGALWLEQGYWSIFHQIHARLKKKHPDFCHTTEENAEPYLKCFDGFLVWRTNYPNMIPLFISIYSGRAQFHGLTYGGEIPGDRQSFFCKAARQTVYSEQLGHFVLSELSYPDDRRLFIKKAAHLRTVLLPYFNTGRMLPPIRYAVPPKKCTALWGGVAAERVSRPAIESCAWRHPNGSVIFVFANSSPKTETAQLAGNTEFWICREGAADPVKSTDPVITIKPRSFEIRVNGQESEARRIQKTLLRIASFDCGKSAGMSVRYQPKKITVKAGGLITVRDAAAVMGCALTKDRHHAGYIQNDALIFFDEVDFGISGTDKIAVNDAVAPNLAGGSIQMILTDSNGKESVIGQVKLKSTGGFKQYQDQTFLLNRRLQGRQKIHFHFKGNAACNFRGWKFF